MKRNVIWGIVNIGMSFYKNMILDKLIQNHTKNPLLGVKYMYMVKKIFNIYVLRFSGLTVFYICETSLAFNFDRELKVLSHWNTNHLIEIWFHDNFLYHSNGIYISWWVGLYNHSRKHPKILNHLIDIRLRNNLLYHSNDIYMSLLLDRLDPYNSSKNLAPPIQLGM